MYRAAIIGVSGYGQMHYDGLKREVENGVAEIVSAVVINQDEEKEKCEWLRCQGAALFTDYREMLDRFRGEIDLCFIPTGIYMHAEMSIAAMRSGANVFVEKPIAATVQELHAIQRVSEETGKFVAVGYQYIYQPGIHRAKQLLLDGTLGRLTALKGHAVTFRDTDYYARNNWAGRLKTNGAWVLDSPFNNAQAHYLNLLCFFAGDEFGKAAEIKTVQAELYRANDIENADTVCMRIETGSGVPICFYATHACAARNFPVLEVIGEKGCLTVDIASGEISVDLNDGAGYVLSHVPDEEHYVHLFRALRNRLENASGFICDLDIAGSQTLCCNGSHESSEIHVVSDEFKSEVTNKEGAVHIEITDIERLIEQAFGEGKLFSELGISDWARPGLPVQMAGYEFFEGGRALRK